MWNSFNIFCERLAPARFQCISLYHQNNFKLFLLIENLVKVIGIWNVCFNSVGVTKSWTIIIDSICFFIKQRIWRCCFWFILMSYWKTFLNLFLWSKVYNKLFCFWIFNNLQWNIHNSINHGWFSRTCWSNN